MVYPNLSARELEATLVEQELEAAIAEWVSTLSDEEVAEMLARKAAAEALEAAGTLDALADPLDRFEPFTMEDGSVLYVARAAGLTQEQAAELHEGMKADCPICSGEHDASHHRRKKPW